MKKLLKIDSVNKVLFLFMLIFWTFFKVNNLFSIMYEQKLPKGTVEGTFHFDLNIKFSAESKLIFPNKVFIYKGTIFGKKIFSEKIVNEEDSKIQCDLLPGEYVSILCPTNDQHKRKYSYANGPTFKILKNGTLILDSTEIKFSKKLNMQIKKIRKTKKEIEVEFKWDAISETDYYTFEFEIAHASSTSKVLTKSINPCYSIQYIENDIANEEKILLKKEEILFKPYYLLKIKCGSFNNGSFFIYWMVYANNNSNYPHIAWESGISSIKIE